MTGQNKNRLPSKRRSLESENNYKDLLLWAKSALPNMAMNSDTQDTNQFETNPLFKQIAFLMKFNIHTCKALIRSSLE